MPNQKIAVVTKGGIAGGHFNQGIPALVELFDRISEHYELHIFQSGTLTPAESASRAYAVTTFWPGLKSLDLLRKIAVDHIGAPYELIHGLWLGGGLHGLRVGQLLRLPVVMSLLGGEVARVPEIGYGGLRARRSRRRLERACRRAAAVTTGSRFQQTKLQSVFDGPAPVIPLGVNAELFSFDPLPAEPPYQFIHVANLTEVKDQATLIRAFDLIRAELDCHLTIVGPDYLDGELQSLVAALGLESLVSFTGPVPNDELPSYYRRAHLLLHSSLYESQAVVALEAMLSGVVVVGTHVGILADLDQRCCVTVAPKDFEGLARSAIDLLADRERLTALRGAARNWATEHSAQWTADRFVELYRSLLERPIAV